MKQKTALLKYHQVSDHYGININTLHGLVRERRIPHKRFGKRFVRFVQAEIEAWIEQNSVDTK